ncbi:alpha/beta hydrolase [Acinetobacter baumannii]|uniref:alpha/beta hydrolase n=1 Tax=Acinetobacter baumannii TaxID=470 RepID=UPI0002B9FC87|nr:alpha/beta hydrolase fold domain-containing protein [Acinetobacter baumannii]AGH35692.1 esterase/lipase/thioesterase [Acinetobacter baumannii D1279779]HAV5551715.1 alpha/beta hydrolase [Acinetobacter baumannii]
MPLLAKIESWLKSRPTSQAVNSLQELRKQLNKDIIDQQGIQHDASYQQSFYVAVSDGAEIEVRVYVPYSLENVEQRPALVFAHGGGWCLGSLDAWNRTCRLLAESIQHVVFSVDYRLAPEFKFPTPLNDFFTAFRYIHKHASLFGIDQNCIAVGGDSAGANIAAAACLKAKQHPEIMVSHQLLFYPALDATMSSNSYSRYAEGYGLESSTMVYCWNQYVQEENEKQNELVSPLLAQSLDGLPNATIFVCEYDPVRDDGERYAQKLWDAGIQVNFHLLKGMIHGAIHMTAITSEATTIYSKIAL